MGKRGQIYILAAILLAVVVYGLSTVVNVVQQEEIRGDFEALSSNYETESSKLINSVLQDDGNVSDAFNNFTFFFTSYSKAKSPNFHIFYALAYKGDIYFGNFMNEDLYIYTSCPIGGDSCPSSSKLPGCLGNVSAQISFEGLTINPEYVLGEFEKFRGSCFWNTEISGVMDYCVGIGGNMYKLPARENVPAIFSLSRLKSGAQVLNSVQGEVSEEQVCANKTEVSCDSCSAVCCWSEDECEEGGCVVCVEDWECTDWGGCVGGQRTRTCTDENDCGTTVSQPPESEACCEEDWQCDAWGACVGGTQSRTCTDQNSCGTTVSKPSETQGCCVESWSCGAWGACVGGKQTRTCTDSANCGTTVNKPATTQSCVCQELWVCGDWGACDCNSHKQTRTCTDYNNCGTTAKKPATTQSCTCKQFQCRDEYWTGWGSCNEGQPSCRSGYDKVSCDSQKCYIFWKRYKCLCRKDWTVCSANPDCGGYTKLPGEQTC